MKNYESYSAVDFASDEDFLKWVKSPNDYPQLSDFWNDWLASNLEKQQEVSEAKELILKFIAPGVYNHRKVELWNRIDASIDEVHDQKRVVSFDKFTNNKLRQLKYAASIVILLGIGLIWMMNLNQFDQQIAIKTVESRVFQNSGLEPKSIFLADGTSVVLYENTSLEVVEGYNQLSREVNVKGGAFFEVKHDLDRPFYVHADGLSTKVLGTSFMVSAYDRKNVMVSVNTGKVSVSKDIKNQKSEVVTLLPNETASLERKTSQLAKVTGIDLGVGAMFGSDFEIVDQPLTAVFDLLNLRYGVTIEYQKANVANCMLNASLVGIPLEDKIRLICKGSNLDYKIDKSKIVISGAGCSAQMP